ncbi:coiled-coil domain-containing protein 40 [Poecilia latipinna]|uniref:coiled-coil domain-containing protein 40 n=1 Tax=Poecilia latipinna TaxID=48699 RepID=UPI00072E8DB9|nr:PREDICTED: coiled-coil domain-containing protein 40 [Poecilia latipinna]
MQNVSDEDQLDEDHLNAQDGASASPSAQQSDDVTHDSVLDPNVAAPAADQLSIGTSEDDRGPEHDEDSPQEEEENEDIFTINPEHPLIQGFQNAFNVYFEKRLEGLRLELKGMVPVKRVGSKKVAELVMELEKTEKKQKAAESKLHDIQESKTETEAELKREQDRLKEAQSHYYNIKNLSRQAKAVVSARQADLDKKQQRVIFAQAAREELQSQVKVMDYTRYKVNAQKTKAEEDKIKQDLYVDHLTKDLDSKAQQVAEYEIQGSAQAQETAEVTKALSEAEMEYESLLMMHKKLLHQWNSNITDIKRHDETVNAMQEAVRAVEDEVILLDREIEGYKKSIYVELENNETLTVQLNRSSMDCVSVEKLINKKKLEREALQAQFTACLNSLSETKQIFAALTKEMTAHQTELKSQKNRLEKLSAARLELQEKIMAYFQQQLTHSKAASHSQNLTNKLVTRKKEKMHQLQLQERDTLSVKLECQKVEQHVNSLTISLESLDEEINKYNKLLNSHENTFASLVRQIRQKETTVNTLKIRIAKIVEITGQEDVHPLQIKIDNILVEIDELAAHIKSEQRLWLLHQGTLVGLTRELDVNKKKMRKLQKDYTGLQMKDIRLDGQTKQEERELAELERGSMVLRKDLEKLCKLKTKNKERNETLEMENIQMETDFRNKLKDAEEQSASLHMKLENIQEEKENLLKCLAKAKQQIMLWERKTIILKETRSVVEFDISQGDIQKMNAEMHRMEIYIDKLTKRQEYLMRESQKVVERRENLDIRKDAMIRDRRQHLAKWELKRSCAGLQRKIQKTLYAFEVYEEEAKELENKKTLLSENIQLQTQQVTELSSTSTKIGRNLENLQDNKDMNQTFLITMQDRNKKLQAVCKGIYKPSSSSETIGATLQSQREHLEECSKVLKQSCEDFPEHQGALHPVTLAAEAFIKIANQ